MFYFASWLHLIGNFYKLPKDLRKNRRAQAPALVVPSHNVHQGGKGSVWDGQTDRRTLPVHFWTDRRKV